MPGPKSGLALGDPKLRSRIILTPILARAIVYNIPYELPPASVLSLATVVYSTYRSIYISYSPCVPNLSFISSLVSKITLKYTGYRRIADT